MAVNEINLTLDKRGNEVGNQILGVIGFIGAPMLLVEMLLYGGDTNPIVGLFGAFYITGWIAGAIGMRRERATGNGKISVIIFSLQIILLILALLSNIQEILGITLETGGVFYGICDAAYPLSHLFMLVVGIFVWRAKIWCGVFRVAPFMVGIALPLFFAINSFAGRTLGIIGFSGLTAIGLAIISYAVFSSKKV